MHAFLPAGLLALSLATPAFALPDEPSALPGGEPLMSLRLAQSTESLPGAAPRLKDPWQAAQLTAGSPILLGAAVIGMSGGGIASSGLILTDLLGPLTLLPGYHYAQAPWRGAAVAAGGYLVEILGAVAGSFVTGHVMSGNYSGLVGLFWGPALALGGYSLWAAHDAYQATERYNQKLLEAGAARP